MTPVRYLGGTLAGLVGLACTAWGQSSRPGWGATPYHDAGGAGVTFRVWAPNATSVSVPGTFNGWATGAHPLAEEGTSGIWSADVAGALAGDQYKFYVNGSLWKRDPRGRMVEHTAGNSIVYDPAAFGWGGDQRLSLDRSDLVIYELHIGSFHDPTPGNGMPGTFQDAIARLDDLADLGISAVEVLPIMEFPGDFSWGYNLSEVYAVENVGYGGPDGLKAFVKACHERGIGVLIDIVHNHYGPWEIDLWNFDGGAGGGIYFYTAGGICCTPWGSRPDYSVAGVRDFIRDSFRMWLEEYHVDGFRWDTPGTMQSYDSGSGYVAIPEASLLIGEINTMIATEFPGAINIAEDAAFGLGFDSEWWNPFKDAVMGQVTRPAGSTLDAGVIQSALNVGHTFTVFSESHDSAGDLNGGLRVPVRIDGANPEGWLARKRSLLAAALTLTAPAVPMIFMGQELHTTATFSDGLPLDWTRAQTFAGIRSFFRDLIRLRRNLDGVSGGLQAGGRNYHGVVDNSNVLAYSGALPGEEEVMVLVNLSPAPQFGVTLYFPRAGAWFVHANSDDPAYAADFAGVGAGYLEAGAMGTVDLGAYSVQVLSQRALPDGDADGDGMENGWEERFFGDPLVAIAGVDDDGDGLSNLEEHIADTHPLQASSRLALDGIEGQSPAGTVAVGWRGGEAARQIVRTSMDGGVTWVPVYTNEPPTSVSNQMEIPASAGGLIRVEAQPATP